MKLHELATEYERIVDAITEGGGELTPELQDELEAVTDAVETKVENIGLYIINANATVKAQREEARRLSDKAVVNENAISSLKAYAMFCLERAGMAKFKTDRVSVSICNNSRPSIVWTKDVLDLPETHSRISLSVDGTRAYEDWKAGIALPDGFQVNQGKHLRIK